MLTLLIVLLIGIPSQLIFAPLGGAGTPAEILGLVLAIVWLFRRITGFGEPRRLTAVHIATLGLFASVLASYLAAVTRPIVGLEVSAADRGLLSFVAFVGMVFVTADGPRDKAELDTLLRRLCLGGGLLASLGVVQFITKMPLTNYIQIPGLTVNSDLASVLGRAGLTRPAGTAVHPIEFGAVLTTILPLALHYAISDRDRGVLVRWFPAVAIGVAIPISISRSAILSAVVGLAVLLPTYEKHIRRRAYGAIVVIFAGLYFVVPGLLGTLTGLFTGISNDSSAASRTDSYSLAFDFISRAPLFGRGFRTFLPEYRILDDQYLGTLVEMGFVGLIAVLAFVVTSIAAARRVRKQSRDPAVRSLAQALAASVAASACSFALYDAFSFPMAASTFFLAIGATGALIRTTANSPKALPIGAD